MKWSSAVSSAPRLDEAIAETASRVRRELGDVPPDLALVFVSSHHAGVYDAVPELVRAALEPQTLIGCSAGGVIGGGHEIEGEAGFSLTAGRLPDVGVVSFHTTEPVPPVIATEPPPQLIVFPEPFSFDAETFLHLLDHRLPGSTVIGGVASGGRQRGQNALFLDDVVHRDGLVGVALSGDVVVDTVVAQGCRPIGEPMFVTRCERNFLYEVDGRSPAAVLSDLHRRAPARDKELFRSSLFLGIVMREQQEYTQGDFLIRNVLGLDGKTGAVAVGALLRPGMVVQFHLRDARTSADDLDTLLGRYAEKPAGSLLFSCLGRGVHLYGRPDHDTDIARRHLGEVPLGGFFCNGEIGPVQGTTFLHGYTSAFGLFRPRSANDPARRR
jgi:small ligand-binding sensory domain FIST